MKTWVEVQGCRGPTVRPAQTVPHEKAAVPETADGDRALLPMLFEVLSASPDADGRFSGPREDGALDGGEHRLIRRDHQRFQRDDLDAATVPPLPRGVSGRSRRGGRSRVGYYRSLPLAAQLPCVAPPSEATETYDEVPRLGMGGHGDIAEAHYRQALALADELGMRPLIAHCHAGLANLYRHTGKRIESDEHFAAATTMYLDGHDILAGEGVRSKRRRVQWELDPPGQEPDVP